MANPIGNLRKSIDNNMSSLKEGGAAALGTLILGGSKAEAAMAGVGQAIITKVVGPLGKLVGITAIATRGIYNLTKAWATMGTGAAAKLETVQNQLRVMLKGLDAAKQRVRELRNFSIATPFKMGDIVAGNRALEGLTRGALTTKKAMTQVGDAAAQAGVNFEDMAVYVGRLYDGLAAGRPVGEVLFRLAELGVISGQARNAIEQLQTSGAGFSEVWRVVESELSRSSGTMAYTSKTLEGLQSTLEDTQDELKATFSANFLEGQKQAVEAQIKTLENLKPVVQGLGSAYGGVVNVASTLGSRFMEWITGFRAVQVVMELTARAAGLLSASILALAGVVGATRLVGWLAGMAVSLGLASRAMVVFAAATKLAGRALLVFSGPLALIGAAVAAVWSVVTMYTDAVERMEQAQREYNGATDAMLSKMEAQRKAIETLDDLAASYADTLGRLAEAYREEARAMGDLRAIKEKQGFLESQGLFNGDEEDAIARRDNARRRIDSLQNELFAKDLVDRGSLKKSDFYTGNMDAMERAKVEAARAEREAARARMTPAEREASLAQEAGDLAQKRGAAVAENNAIEAARVKSAELGAAMGKNKARQSEIKEQMGEVDPGSFEAYQALIDELKRLEEEEKNLVETELKLAEESKSTIAVLQAKLALYAKYKAAVQGAAAAETAFREAQAAAAKEDATDEEKAGVAKAAEQLKRLKEEEAKLKGLVDTNQIDPAKAQEMAQELEREKERLRRDLLNRQEEIAIQQRLEEEKKNREKSRAEARGQTAATVAQEEGGAMAAAQAEIAAEMERLELQKQYKEIDDEIYEQRKRGLESEKRMLEQRRAMAAAENAAGVAAGGMNLEAKIARMTGDGDKARKLEEAAIRKEEEAGLERRVREIMDATGMSEQEAGKQAGTEMQQARAGRALDAEGGLLQALLGQGQVVDSMQRIGGGGGVGGGPNIGDVVKRLDDLIRAVKEGREIELRL